MQFFASFGVVDDRTYRGLDIDRLPFVTGTVAAFSMPASLGFMFGVEAEVEKRILMGTGDQVDAAPASTISTARPAAWNELLPAKGQTAVTAVAGLYVDSYFVDKHEWAGVTTRLGLRACFDAYEAAHAAAVAKFHYTGDLGEQGIVLGPSDVLAGLELCAALAHNDRAARNQLAAENFYAQPLRVGITPILGTA